MSKHDSDFLSEAGSPLNTGIIGTHLLCELLVSVRVSLLY